MLWKVWGFHVGDYEECRVLYKLWSPSLYYYLRPANILFIFGQTFASARCSHTLSVYLYYMYICTYVCMYVCVYVRTYVCMYVRMYVCTYVRMYDVRTYVCMYVCMHACMPAASNKQSRATEGSVQHFLGSIQNKYRTSLIPTELDFAQTRSKKWASEKGCYSL
jgi:hypothetical protein